MSERVKSIMEENTPQDDPVLRDKARATRVTLDLGFIEAGNLFAASMQQATDIMVPREGKPAPSPAHVETARELVALAVKINTAMDAQLPASEGFHTGLPRIVKDFADHFGLSDAIPEGTAIRAEDPILTVLRSIARSAKDGPGPDKSKLN